MKPTYVIPGIIEGEATYTPPSDEETSIPKITIIPGLKELSKSSRGIVEGCDHDKMRLTQENCVADLVKVMGKKEYKMQQRNNYTTRSDKLPDKFLWNTGYGALPPLPGIFQVEEPTLKIKEYKQNWDNLFATISKLVEDKSDTESIFICAHQYLLVNKFFSFQKDKKKHFKNCCCIEVKIDKEGNVTMKVFHGGEVNDPKHDYLETGQKLGEELLNKDSFPLKSTLNNLNGKTIYIIRHGEGVHNVANTLEKLGNPTKMLNAMLTKEGVAQAQRLHKKFMDEGVDLHPSTSIYISSPLDRAIETLITAVMYNAQFIALKTRFYELREMRYPEEAIAAAENPVDDQEEVLTEDDKIMKKWLIENDPEFAAEEAEQLAQKSPGFTERVEEQPPPSNGGKRRTRKGKRMMKSKKNKRMNMKKSKKNRKNKTRGAR